MDVGGKGTTISHEQILAAEYSHFQNVTLAKELADSRTISLDRADLYVKEQENGELREKDSRVEKQSSAERHTILSRHENSRAVESHPELKEANATPLGGGVRFDRQLSIDKKSYVNAEIIG